ncbi:MAG: IS630 family transposase [Gallionella sp.]|nr:IS630 family transposase [Gallionella sp.]
MEKKLPERLAAEQAAFAVARPLRLMFQDEARFGRISDVRHCWDKKPHRPLVRAMLTQQYTYAYAAVSPVDGKFDSLILPQVNGHCMQLFLNEIAARYPDENVVMVIDGAGWHRSQELKLPDNVRTVLLPPYAPELNPQEHVWDELREKFFHNRAFDSMDAPETHLEAALKSFELSPERMRSIAGWDWIINSIYK